MKEGGEYQEKRQRNNVAVKKSREKSRAKAKDTHQRVARLKKENEDLEMKVQLLAKELSVLKDLFLAHASSVAIEHDSCPDTKATVQPKEEKPAVDVQQASPGVVGSPVNQEGFENDHEYFSPPSTQCAC